MTRDEQQKILDRIATLLNLTIERGCTPSEVCAAASRIGTIVQKYNLTVSFPGAPGARTAHTGDNTRHSARTEQQRRASSPLGIFSYGDVLVIGQSEKAILVRDRDGAEFWVPRSQLRSESLLFRTGSRGTLNVSSWWAHKQDWA